MRQCRRAMSAAAVVFCTRNGRSRRAVACSRGRSTTSAAAVVFRTDDLRALIVRKACGDAAPTRARAYLRTEALLLAVKYAMPGEPDTRAIDWKTLVWESGNMPIKRRWLTLRTHVLKELDALRDRLRPLERMVRDRAPPTSALGALYQTLRPKWAEIEANISWLHTQAESGLFAAEHAAYVKERNDWCARMTAAKRAREAKTAWRARWRKGRVVEYKDR